MNGETFELSTLIGLGGLMLTLIGLIGVVLYRLGQLAARVDRQGVEISESRQEMRDMREEYRQEMRDMREESRQDIREMREENRRNHQQLLQALAHHSHDPATGFATFQVPPGME